MGLPFTDRSIQTQTAGGVWVPNETALPPIVILTITMEQVTALTLPPSVLDVEKRYTSPWTSLSDAHANLLRLGYQFGAAGTMPNVRDGGGRLLNRSIKATYRLTAAGKLDLSHVDTVAIADIVIDAEVQSRLALDPAAVERYRDEYVAGTRFPAVILFREKQGAPLILADGFHRVEAARQANIVRIAAIILRGGRRAAQLYAASANLRHGVRPTHDDAKHAARRFLLDTEWRAWSDREIARRTGLSHTSVGKLRAALEAEGAIAPVPARTYTRAGKTQAMATASIGAFPVAPPPAAVGTSNGASASPPLHAMERGQGGEDDDHEFVSRTVSSPPLQAVERGQGGEVRSSMLPNPPTPPPQGWEQQRAAAAEQRQQRATESRETPGTRMRAELAACGIEAAQVVAHVNGRTGEFTAAFDFAHVYDDERDARRAAARYATRIVRAGYDLLDCGVDIDATMTIASIRTPMVCFKEPSQ
ncbi:MAG: hypothetical protein L6Q98_17685 [Anaerolineae bacterium]|nr:hypothetical protein [Anaerolineae bacterium]NUQ05961.1 hypothetical protein [Anaerolineae bacterium]